MALIPLNIGLLNSTDEAQWIETGQHTTAIIPQPARPVIIIDHPTPTTTAVGTLSSYLETGRQYHPLARGTFIQRIRTGYYHYEAKVELRTCAVAAAYAGAFGSAAVEKLDLFSYSQVCWELGQKLGFNPDQLQVTGPTGRRNSLAQEMTQLVDDNWWNRQGVAKWLRSLNL